MKAITLRLPDEMHEALRTEAFNRRMSITAIVVDAIEHRRVNGSLGCDVCGNPKVSHVSTPGGFRFCEAHYRPGPKIGGIPDLTEEESDAYWKAISDE